MTRSHWEPISFDVTIATDSEPGWPGNSRWRHTRTEPPTLDPMSWHVLELLFGVPPELMAHRP